MDKPIQEAQQYLFDKLKAKWKLSDEQFDCYGRCYRNQSEDSGYIAEVFTNYLDYQEVYVNDNVTVTSFFGVGEQFKYNGQFNVPVHLVFWVDLRKLYPTIEHRADEEARMAVFDVVKMLGIETTEIEVILGIDNVLKEYSGTRRNLGLQFRDMHPLHCFRMNFNIDYINNC